VASFTIGLPIPRAASPADSALFLGRPATTDAATRT